MKIVTKTVLENVVKCLSCEFETIVDNAGDAINTAQKHLTEQTTGSVDIFPEYGNVMHVVRIEGRVKVTAEVQQEDPEPLLDQANGK